MKPVEWEVDDDGCWLFTGWIDKQGYGKINTLKQYAHRWTYTQFVGEIPEGFVLDHLCHTNDPTCQAGVECKHRRCVNPFHLEAVTSAENGVRSAAIKVEQTHCVNGHEFTPENTYVRKEGRRVCRECRKLNLRKWYAANKEDVKERRARAKG